MKSLDEHMASLTPRQRTRVEKRTKELLDEEISRRTLATMDSSMKNFKAGKVSKPIKLKGVKMAKRSKAMEEADFRVEVQAYLKDGTWGSLTPKERAMLDKVKGPKQSGGLVEQLKSFFYHKPASKPQTAN